MVGSRDDRFEAEPPMPERAELEAAMIASEQDVAAGRTVVLEDVLRTLDETAGKIERRRTARRA